MLDAVPKVRTLDAIPFKRFLRGLWLSGLRIDELNRLDWNLASGLHVDTTERLRLIVFLGAQKNGRDTFLPAPEEFWDMIDKPGVSRLGRIFPIPGKYGDQMTTRNIGRRIGEIGKAAGVVVNPKSGKCATAHDLRAAYITRLASAMKMSQAQARHSDPKTTSQFYVRHEAAELARAAGWL